MPMLILNEQAALARLRAAPPLELTPALLWVATNFKDPTDPEIVASGHHRDRYDVCPGPVSEATIRECIALLVREGILVPVDWAAWGVDERVWAAQNTLSIIAQLNARIASTVYGLGLDADAAAGAPVAESLGRIRRELEAVTRELQTRQAAYVERQLEAHGIGPTTKGLKLSLSGQRRPDGWLAVGFPPADIAVNFLWGLPFPDNSADLIYSAHILEHLHYKTDALALLNDVRRVLAPSGAVRVVVPDIGAFAAAYASGNLDFFRKRRERITFGAVLPTPTPLAELLDYAGSGPRFRPEIFFGHKFGYDWETLAALLEEAGFREITRSSYMESAIPGLNLDGYSDFAGMEHAGALNSLFVDARK
jgi:SAM-dependent methyltransferase